MPISQIKQYIDWIVEGNRTLEARLEMMQKHKQAVLDEILIMQESLKGIEFKITRYTHQIQESNQDED